ncbi:DegT/DnrJ/EryC1/StrS family aminotransferase [candidate division NPL-UPA2 bacterium]|nr:DegT/DnrJ/EryC1/StrS family aminotransferase [candidate division NPL-UPA2 bacterium]
MGEKLAKDGGKAVGEGKEFPGWPWFSEETIQAAMEPLRTGQINYWTGKLGMEFENKFAEWNGSRYAISTTNGTSALHVALAGLEIGPGDEVIVPSYTFIASSFCVLQAGAVPIFADVDRKTHCLSPQDVKAKITERTRAIIPVHLYGNVCDMDELLTIAKKHNLYVVEDCAQAHGATYKGKKVGTWGDVGAFSFCQSKAFTTGGEGGMVTTDNEEVMWHCKSFRDHGYDVYTRLSLLEAEDKLTYIHNRVGYNYRMTELQSAIGLKELEKFDSWNLPARQRNGSILIEELRDCPQVWQLPIHNEEEKTNGFFVFPVVLDIDKMSCDIEQFKEALGAEKVPVWRCFWPQGYKEKVYREHRGFGKAKFPFESKEYTNPESVKYEDNYCPNAAWLEERTFITLCHPRLEEEHMRLIGKAIKKVAQAYAK